MQTPHVQAALEVFGSELPVPPAMHSSSPLDVL